MPGEGRQLPGGRATRQLEATVRALRASDRHPTAEQVYREVLERLPSVSLGTVYRNLRKLVDDGRALAITVCGQPARFDGRAGPHDHFLCLRCDRLVDVEATAASPELPMLPGGHRVADRRVVYRGTCASCAAGARAGG